MTAPTLDAFDELLEPADVHVAQCLSTLTGESDPSVALAVAFAVRAVGRLGVRGPAVVPRRSAGPNYPGPRRSTGCEPCRPAR